MAFQYPRTVVSGPALKRLQSDEGEVGVFWIGEINEEVVPRTSLFITDPPYNIGVEYGSISDRKTAEEYRDVIGEVLEACHRSASENAHLFLIHYPEAVANLWPTITEHWEFKQWITWVYPSNRGRSKNKWTRGQRVVLWLTKGKPDFEPKGVLQRFKNLTDRRVKGHMANGLRGVPLYDWWEIPQVMNSNKEYRGYENQIPSELLRRIILCASKPGDWVGDPFSGSFSTSRTALGLGRRAWGCDINKDVSKYIPESVEWVKRQDDGGAMVIDSDQYDEVLKHITPEQLDNSLFKLLANAGIDELTEIIGPVNGPRVYSAIHEQE